MNCLMLALSQIFLTRYTENLTLRPLCGLNKSSFMTILCSILGWDYKQDVVK